MQTICANSTATGGAIAIIRVSGPESITIADKIFRSANGKPLAEAKGQTLHYGQIVQSQPVSAEEVLGAVIDDVLLSLFRAPRSYTGEDSVEISCHGSSYIINEILHLLCAHGCRMAEPGEFTKRAFLNGKLDLSQAEAVADLIASSNAATHRLAMSQMRGGFSRELKGLREQLLHMTALLELEIDFSEEDVEFADRQQLQQLATTIDEVITRLVDSFRTGNAIKNGIPVAIVGRTNVGKSTLLNRLLNDDRAIVSDIHGTTRDVIEDTAIINGITFRFIDTAGLRDTTDVVERLGIERTKQKMQDAQIILYLSDDIKDFSDLKDLNDFKDLKNFNAPTPSLLLKVLTKIDQQTSNQTTLPPDVLPISAKEGTNIAALEQALVKAAGIRPTEDSDIIVTNLRHVEALRKAQTAIRTVRQQLCDGISGDIISLDLHACIDALAEIVGEVSSQDTLNSIFSSFCIGK